MMLPERDFYRVKEICAVLGIGRMALWKRIKKGTMPELEKLNVRVAGYSKETLSKIRSGIQQK